MKKPSSVQKALNLDVNIELTKKRANLLHEVRKAKREGRLAKYFVDYNGEISLYKLIEDIRDRLNCGVMLISHDLHVVMSKTDRVICLNGHICCHGTPANVASSDEFRVLFGDQAASARALYEHRHDHEHLPDGQIRSAGDATGCAGHDHDHDHGHGHGAASASEGEKIDA